MPWSHYGDPTLFIPEPRGLKTVLKLEKNDPIAFTVWVRAIRSELKNLMSLGTFSIEKNRKEEKVIPTTLVLKIKLTSDGSWDKAKARICVCGDIQNISAVEETWTPTSTKRTLRIFLADEAKNNATIKQLDYVRAFLHALGCAQDLFHYQKNIIKSVLNMVNIMKQH